MEALKQTVRPKHQVLILKCYPRLPKNSSAAEIKPNGSELSYLLYYASSRRSKLSKVGAFLEKKTIHDLWKYRTASVQITLQILTAFLNNPAIGGAGPQGFGLFAPYILRILKEVLKDANEAILIEAAVPTWDSFCRHQDHVALSADAEFAALFASVVSLWAGYATKEQIQSNKTTERRGKMRVGVTDNVKLRMAGLQALKSTVDSDTLGTEAGRQLNTVMPVILQNLYDGDGDLDQIMELSAEMDVQEKEKGVKPRPSMMTMREALDENGDVRAAETTVDEADRLADQEASLQALRCLKSVFTFENRAQIRTATNCVLRFIVSHRPNPIKFEKAQGDGDAEDQWAIQLFKAICNWTPVQDRFVAIFTAVEMLISSPVTDDDIWRQLLLARIISKLLASDINLIGLSVMDVLLGLLQHILKHIRATSSGTIQNGTSDTASTNDSHHSGVPQKPAATAGPIIDTNTQKSPIRVRLLTQLQQCVSNLAVHVYYTDQISDMIGAIILRLKPSLVNVGNNLQVPAHNASIVTGTSSIGGEDSASPAPSDAGINSNGSPRSAIRALAAGFFFASPSARETALNAITRILLAANRAAGNETSYVSTHRNPVPLQIWEGTQWLLRDPELTVREAYVRSFRTWLTHELPKLGLEKQAEEEKKADKERKRKSLNSDLARRAASTASAKKAASRRDQTKVLQGIHLAVVDALAFEAAAKAAPGTAVTADQAITTSPTATSPIETPFSPSEQQFTIALKSEPTSLETLDTDLSHLSEKLHLIPLDDFRAQLPPALPPHPPSPKAHSGSTNNNNGNGNGPPSSSGADDHERRPSAAQSLSRGSGAKGSPSANGMARGSDRLDFAPDTATSGGAPAPAVAVDDLKRILAADGTARSISVSSSVGGGGGRQRSASRSKTLSNVAGAAAAQREGHGNGAGAGAVHGLHSAGGSGMLAGSGAGTGGVSKTEAVGRRSVSIRNGSVNGTPPPPNFSGKVYREGGSVRYSVDGVRPAQFAAAGAGNGAGSVLMKGDGRGDEEEGEEDSLMEIEGSWGTSFASPGRERKGGVDVVRLLEGIAVEEEESGGLGGMGGGGLGRMPA